MTRQQFDETLGADAPPAALEPILAALWLARAGRWAAAHEIAQGGEGTAAFDRLHAYLHRVEGDVGNAGYWYRRAGVAAFKGSPDQEWDALVAAHVS